MEALVGAARSLQRNVQDEVERADASVREAGRELATAGERLSQARTALERSMSELTPQVASAQTAAPANGGRDSRAAGTSPGRSGRSRVSRACPARQVPGGRSAAAVRPVKRTGSCASGPRRWRPVGHLLRREWPRRTERSPRQELRKDVCDRLKRWSCRLPYAGGRRLTSN